MESKIASVEILGTRQDTGRRRARLVSDEMLKETLVRAALSAIFTEDIAVELKHGGGVASSYLSKGFRPITSGALVTCDPQGRACLWECVAPAEKLTLGKIARRCLHEAGPIFDGRYNYDSMEAASTEVARIHASTVAAGRCYATVTFTTDPEIRDLLFAAAKGKDCVFALRDLLLDRGETKLAAALDGKSGLSAVLALSQA